MDRIKFCINGTEYSVGGDISSDVMLLDYIRNYLQLRGTKYMCREAGCGACMVTASKCPGEPQVAVNSCMISIGSCDGWDIWTIESMGNKKTGYHLLQKTLAEHHGTQCGYCTPGWIMAMQGLLQSRPNLTMLEIEKSLASNNCRCTGIRPILEAFKRFAIDAPKQDRIVDIEDLFICKKSGRPCSKKTACDEDEWCLVREEDCNADAPKKIILKDGKIWYKPKTLQDVFKAMKESPNSYMLVAGNTAKGAVPIDEYPNHIIDVSRLPELKTVLLDQNYIIGAGHTLTEFMDILKTGASQEYFSYFSKLYDHVDLVAHIPVRNIGTIAGNLMLKHNDNSYPSDLYVLCDTVGAELTIVDWNGFQITVTMENFLKLDMKGKVILNVLFPPLNREYLLYTYKLMPRAQNAHAIVTCGFLFKMRGNSFVVDCARIAYGNLSAKFLRAKATEAFLVNKQLFTNKTLQGALKVLDGEMVVEEKPPEPSAAYRRFITKSLFFKALLNLCPPANIGPRYASGAISLHQTRPVSDGRQIFTTNPTIWPLNQPIQKLEAMIQCSGEARYTEDIPSFHNEVFGAFVLSTVGKGTIASIDATNALKFPGVIAFYTAKDIPGLNSFTPADSILYTSNEEILCSGNVKYHGDVIGIIAAETQYAAERGAKLVVVRYTNVTKPVIDIKEAIKDPTRSTLFNTVTATETGTDVFKTITGSNTFYGQYHFTMETQVCVAKPTEEGLEVHSATQWLDGTQIMISRALNIDQNKIDCYVRYVGGAYGVKISRSIQVAVGCSLVVHKLNRPCRFILPITTNFKTVGKRLPFVSNYQVAVNQTGEIQSLTESLYEDNGYKINETLSALGMDVYNNCYNKKRINYTVYDTLTDTAKNTWCRSPGTLEAIAAMELIMEQISYTLSLDPVAVRLANLDETISADVTGMVEQLKVDADYTARKAAADSFNAQNRWKKRGIGWALSRWAFPAALNLDINLSVYRADASVVITHAGVEIGQGINTKAAQIAAYLLKIPVEKIQIKGNNTIVAPNCLMTGGSVTTQSVIIGLRRCIDELNARLDPIRATLTNPTWEQLIAAAFTANVDLHAHGFVSFADLQRYNIFGAAVCEVEVDLLTGEFETRRVDILQDVGLSISPEIDVGQVEGGFMMGFGYWTCERLVYAPTGEVLTNRTWDYHVPEARDIPLDFRVYFKKNSASSDVILGAKGTGEPSTCLANVVAFAIRRAVALGRQEYGIPTTQWFNMDGPCTTENICLAINTNTSEFKLN